MATSLTLKLSQSEPVWAKVFDLQANAHFSEALDLLQSAPRVDEQADLFCRVFEANLRMCVAALRGNPPCEVDASMIKQIASDSHIRGLVGVEIEAWLLIFDAFDSLREEARGNLSKLESVMDSSSLRRWNIRKARSLSYAGHLTEAYDTLLPYSAFLADEDADNDDSLCALLVELGRIATELGKYSDAVDIYNQAVNCSKSPHNQGLALIRLSNALERMSRPAQADKRRIEYFTLIQRDYPTQCAACSMNFGKEPKFLIPCCKTIVHSECLRQVVSDIDESETSCPFCSTLFRISNVVDPTAVEGRKYKRTKKGGLDHMEQNLPPSFGGANEPSPPFNI